MHWWPDTRRVTLVATTIGIVVLGIAAEHERFDWAETRGWLPDLLVGWTLAGLGIAAVALGRPRGAGLLLVAAGVTWFFGNFYDTGHEWLDSTAGHLSWVFLAPLIQLSLAYPTGGPRTRVAATGIAAAWLAVIGVTWLDSSGETARVIVLAVLTALGSIVWVGAKGRAKREAGRGLAALGALLACALVIPRLGEVGSWDVETLALDTGIALVGIWLFIGLPYPKKLTERVIELDESVGTIRDALAGLLDDPALEVGYAIEWGRFVDDDGRQIAHSRRGRVTTEIEGDPTAAIVVHDPAVLTRDDDRRAVSVAVTLAAERARLREEVRGRANEIARSTRRLIRAEDDARMQSAARLASGPGEMLAASARIIREAARAPSGDTELDTALARAAEQLALAEADLDAFAGGLAIPALEAGLPGAIADLVDGLPLEVDLRVDDIDYEPQIATTIWFLCAEGITNVLKHARASRLLVSVVEASTDIRVTVEDDGRGNVDLTGAGITGLRDRVAAHGGRFRVVSTNTGGTRLVADLPRVVVA